MLINDLFNNNKQGVAEGRFDEPLTGWHIVYRNSGNPVHATPSFETKEQAQKYLMTRMFANHQDYKVVHTAGVGVAEGEVIPFKRPQSQTAVSWQKLPKDVLTLANDWYWADYEGGGSAAIMDPKGLGSGFANQKKYLGAQLQQRGWAIDFDDEFENVVLKNKQGQTILLPIEDAQTFSGWATGINLVTEQGMAEGKADYNFDIEDLKRLEQIRDLATLKAQALELISKPSAKPMKPEKVEWFRNALNRMDSPLKVIKLMYDLLLSGEGKAVVGSRSSMNPNTYRQRFGEQGIVENQDWMKDLAAKAAAMSKPGTPYVPPKQDAEKARRDLTARYPNIDELVAAAEKRRDPYYQYAEGPAYYRGREAEHEYQRLRQIQRVIQGLNEMNFGGVGQTTDSATGDITTSFNQGPLSVSQTKTPGGYTKQTDQQVNLGTATLGARTVGPNIGAGQLAGTTTKTATNNITGQAKQQVKGVGFGGATGATVGKNYVDQYSVNENVARMQYLAGIRPAR